GLLFLHTYVLLLVVAGQSIGADFQNLEREQGALDPGGGDLDPQLAEDVVLVDLLGVVEGQTLKPFGEERCGGLGYCAPAAVEADVLDHAVLELKVHPHDVAAERVILLVADVGVLEPAIVPRVLVVVEDVLAVELIVNCGHQAKILWASLMEVTSRSTSSFCV